MYNRLCLAATCLFVAVVMVRATGGISRGSTYTAETTEPAENAQSIPSPRILAHSAFSALDRLNWRMPVPRLQASSGQAAPAAPQAGYVGSDTCMACHSEGDSLKGTPHAQAKNPRTPEATHGCESCHGPGQGHVDDDNKGHIRKFGQITHAETNQTCLGCHNRGGHAGWEDSAHDRRDLYHLRLDVHGPEQDFLALGRDPSPRRTCGESRNIEFRPAHGGGGLFGISIVICIAGTLTRSGPGATPRPAPRPPAG